MTNHHPITPPPELVRQWCRFRKATNPEAMWLRVSTEAAQWGADQELEACIDWISVYHGLEHPELLIELLRAARRPKPPSLKEQALADLHEIYISQPFPAGDSRFKSIRIALEQLDD